MSLSGILIHLPLIISQNLFADFRFEIVKKNAICIQYNDRYTYSICTCVRVRVVPFSKLKVTTFYSLYLEISLNFWINDILFSITAVIFVNGTRIKDAALWLWCLFCIGFLIVWIPPTLYCLILCLLLKEWFQKSTETKGVSCCDAA